MKIKIELHLPFQKLEHYNIETNLDDIIQALPENSSINKQEILDSILKEGEFDSDYFGLEKNENSEIILFGKNESEFLNILNVLENDKFFYIKIHHHFNIESGDEYTEISRGEHQKTLLWCGPFQEYAIANKEEIEKYEADSNANLIKNIPNRHKEYLIKSKDFNYDEWLNKLFLHRKDFREGFAKASEFVCFDEMSRNEIESGVDGVYKDQNTGEIIKNVVEEYYQICENLVILYKDGEEVDSGYLELTLFSNIAVWDSGVCQGYDRQEEDSFVMSDVDYDDISLNTEREIDRYNDYDYASDAFDELVWDFEKDKLMQAH